MYLILFTFNLLLLSFPTVIFADSEIVINEVVVHPGSDKHEWIEIYSSNEMSFDGFWVDDDTNFTDDSGSSSKKEINGSIKGSDTRFTVYTLTSALFNNSADTVALFDPQGNLLDSFIYEEDPGENTSLGRYPDGIGEVRILSITTQKEANSGPRPTETPTPSPTEKPVKTPTSAKVAKSPTSHKTIESENSEEETLGTQITGIKTKPAVKKVATNGAIPTAILHKKKISKEMQTTKPTPTVMVESATTSPIAAGSIILGGMLACACGILIYLKKRNTSL